jgi:hypothetical protein
LTGSGQLHATTLLTHLCHARFRLSAAQFDDHSHFADRNLLF